MKLSELPIGSIVRHPKVKYLDAVIEWEVVAKNHEGYPKNSVTLQTKQIITAKAMDAREPENSNSSRRSFGNNNTTVANLMQWLNSAVSNWYKAQHGVDQAPDNKPDVTYNPYASEAGFLTNFPKQFTDAILPTTLTTVIPNTDGGGVSTEVRKVFLPSRTEVGLGDERSGSPEGSKWEKYTDNVSRQKTRTAECIAQDESSTANGIHWLRTPSSSSANSVRLVASDGALSVTDARGGNIGVAPALNLSGDLKVIPLGDSFTLRLSEDSEELSLGDLPEGVTLVVPEVKYHESSEDIVFRKIANNHYGMNEATLITDKIETLKAFDAKESTNPINDRKSYGNNQYALSNIRKWLNSREQDWYKGEHQYDAPPTEENVWSGHNPYDKEEGFLSSFPQEFVDTIITVSRQVLIPNIDGTETIPVQDKMFLLSRTEMGLGDEKGGKPEGKLIPYFNEKDNRNAYPTKYAVEQSTYTNQTIAENKTFRWWISTPNAGTPRHVRYISDGLIGYENAYLGTVGVRPALNLPQDLKVSTTPNADGHFEIILKYTPTQTKVNINGQPKDINAIYVNINGQAREVTGMYANINGQAKEIL